MKIVHIITCLAAGGTQKQLLNICINDKENEHIIISLWSQKSNFLRILIRRSRYIILIFYQKKVFIEIIKLYRLLKLLRPDIVQTWLYHADLIGGITSRLAGINIIIWSIRSLPLTLNEAKLNTFLISRLCIVLSILFQLLL